MPTFVNFCYSASDFGFTYLCHIYDDAHLCNLHVRSVMLGNVPSLKCVQYTWLHPTVYITLQPSDNVWHNGAQNNQSLPDGLGEQFLCWSSKFMSLNFHTKKWVTLSLLSGFFLFWKFITFNNLTIVPRIHGAGAECSTSQLLTYTSTIIQTFLMRSIWTLPYCTPCHLATDTLKYLHISSSPVKKYSAVRILIASFGFW